MSVCYDALGIEPKPQPFPDFTYTLGEAAQLFDFSFDDVATWADVCGDRKFTMATTGTSGAIFSILGLGVISANESYRFAIMPSYDRALHGVYPMTYYLYFDDY